jgi:hypothetical protein
MQTLMQTAVLNPIQAGLARVVAVLPSVLLAVVLLLVGALLAQLLRKGIEKAFTVGQIDVWCDKVGLNTLLSHLGLGRSPTKVVAVLAWWFLFLVFLTGAANVLNLSIVSAVLDRLLSVAPRVVSAAFVLGSGVFVGTVLKDIVYNACMANRVKGASALSKLTRTVVVAYTAVTALEILGITQAITPATMQIILVSAGLASAIAFGLGGRDAAADILSHIRGKD